VSYSTPGSRPPPNTPPTITAIPAQYIAQDTVAGPLAFTVNDQESPASSLIVTASSSDQTLVPNGNIALSGSGSNRSVSVTPSAGLTGSATITLTVSDGTDSTNTSFLLTVAASGYTPAAASYNGLFYDTNQVQLASAGSFKLSTTTKSSYSGKLQLQGKSYSFSGKLDAFGRGSNSIPRKADSPIVVLFDCGASNSSAAVIGSVSAANWLASASADRMIFNSRTNPAPWAGTYTLVLPGQNYGPDSLGHSFGTIKVTTSGTVSFAGSLADGTRASQASWLSKDGMWPFYSSLYSGKGLLMSWLAVTSAPTNVPDITGLASWIKSADPKALFYPEGFTNQCYSAGSIYIKPSTNTQHVVHLNKAKLHFSGGNLPDSFTNIVDIIASSKVVNDSTNLLSMSFSLTSGTFSGQVLDPGTKSTKKFSGVVLQKLTSGYGMLVGTNLTSQVELTP
jgi:hypothetical protein